MSLPDESSGDENNSFPEKQIVASTPPDNSGKPIDLRYVAYNEDITICGAKNSGKSYLANELLKSLNGVTVFVWDFNHQFHDARSILCHDITELLEIYDVAKRGHYILQAYDFSQSAFEKFCEECFKRSNIVIIFDELHNFVSKQSIIRPFQNLVLSGRPRGLSLISISTRPASLPNAVLSNSNHVFCFRLNIASDVKFLETWMGSEVWQLMPKNKRVKHFDLPELPEHTFFYRNQSLPTGEIGKV